MDYGEENVYIIEPTAFANYREKNKEKNNQSHHLKLLYSYQLILEFIVEFILHIQIIMTLLIGLTWKRKKDSAKWKEICRFFLL